MRKRTHAEVVTADALLHRGAYHRAQERRGHAEGRHAGAPREVDDVRDAGRGRGVAPRAAPLREDGADVVTDGEETVEYTVGRAWLGVGVRVGVGVGVRAGVKVRVGVGVRVGVRIRVGVGVSTTCCLPRPASLGMSDGCTRWSTTGLSGRLSRFRFRDRVRVRVHALEHHGPVGETSKVVSSK